MDFMKVLDQTVREIKREVNLKVLKVPEIEQKVLDATSDESWGPHGSDLAHIARATKRFGECEMIMNVLWARLGATGASWRHVYKALAVIEYLLANGSERAIDGIIDNSSQIAKLSRFEYVEANGKDSGFNVRKKAETVLAILDDKEKLQQIREKAAATRDKYIGLSSTGITYKSRAASVGSGSYSSGDRYGTMGTSREADSSKDSYRGTEWRNKETKSNYSRSNQRLKETISDAISYKSTKGVGHNRRFLSSYIVSVVSIFTSKNINNDFTNLLSYNKLKGSGCTFNLLILMCHRNKDSSTSKTKPFSKLSPAPGAPSAQRANVQDDDDFNPRGSSTAANASSNHVDLFGPNLIDDLFDANASTSTVTPTVGTAAVADIDLFADAAFQSANAPIEASTGSPTQDNIDLFAGRSSFASSFTSDIEFSVCNRPNKSLEQKLSEHSSSSAFDPFVPSFVASFPSDTVSSVRDSPSKSSQEKLPMPEHSSTTAFDSFAAIPLEELSFSTFTSHTESPTAGATDSTNKSLTNLGQASMSAPKSVAKKETFQVKSGIWADSLSRGLIDLNITAPKKVDLSDVGVVGQLSDASEEKGPAASWYTGSAMAIRSGLGRSGFPSSTGTTGGSGNFQQQQFGNFK